MVNNYRTEKSLKACILHVSGGIEPLNIHAYPGTYCDNRTKPTPLTAFQTIFGIFHFSLAVCNLINLNNNFYIVKFKNINHH